MEELKLLFVSVRSVSASCRMTKDQQDTYKKLNDKYKELSGSRATYSICNKDSFLKKVETFINNASND